MKTTIALAAALLAAAPLVGGDATLHSFTMKTIDGKEQPLSAYKGKAVLVVNTASECGYTPQYAGLEKLYQRYKGRGFAIAAFPSNDFGGQEPGSDPEIKRFCTSRYRTTFDLYSKIPVKGEGAHPLFAFLTSRPGMEGPVKWNFGKFLVDGEGKLVARFDSKVDPLASELVSKLEPLLAR